MSSCSDMRQSNGASVPEVGAASSGGRSTRKRKQTQMGDQLHNVIGIEKSDVVSVTCTSGDREGGRVQMPQAIGKRRRQEISGDILSHESEENDISIADADGIDPHPIPGARSFRRNEGPKAVPSRQPVAGNENEPPYEPDELALIFEQLAAAPFMEVEIADVEWAVDEIEYYDSDDSGIFFD